MLNVGQIEEGYVLDHIPAGKSPLPLHFPRGSSHWQLRYKEELWNFPRIVMFWQFPLRR